MGDGLTHPRLCGTPGRGTISSPNRSATPGRLRRLLGHLPLHPRRQTRGRSRLAHRAVRAHAMFGTQANKRKLETNTSANGPLLSTAILRVDSGGPHLL